MTRTASDSYGFLFRHHRGPAGHRYHVFVVHPTGVSVHDYDGDGRAIRLYLSSPLDILETATTESERICRIAITNAEVAGYFEQTEHIVESKLDLSAAPWGGELEKA